MISAPAFGAVVTNVADGTVPAAAFGVAVTPAQLAYGSSANLGVLSSTNRGYGLWINVNSIGSASIARNMSMQFGIDLGGAASFTDWGGPLLVSDAATWMSGGAGGGIWIYLPVSFPAGASIGAKASCSGATLTAFRVLLATAIKPRAPLGWYGSTWRTYGGVSATTFGTAVTPGTASEGAWAAISGTLTERVRFLDFGYGCSSNAMTNNAVHVDIGVGDATTKRLAVANAMLVTSASETVQKQLPIGGWCDAMPGDIIYGRCQVGPNTADTGVTLAAYGVV